MMSISSAAGRRLAKAGKRWRDTHGTTAEGSHEQIINMTRQMERPPHFLTADYFHRRVAERELEDAALEVARELMAQGFHEMEGD